MMTGVVTSDREAVIRVPVRGASGQERQLEAVIDTGFTGFLTLPRQLIAELALAFVGTTQGILGDGSTVSLDVFEGTVLWDNRERRVVILAAEGSVLVGMGMLTGYHVTLEVAEGGLVAIEALS